MILCLGKQACHLTAVVFSLCDCKMKPELVLAPAQFRFSIVTLDLWSEHFYSTTGTVTMD